MHIHAITVDVGHPRNEIKGVRSEPTINKPYVCIPEDWSAWSGSIEKSLALSGLIEMRFGSMIGDTIAIAFCPDDPTCTEEDADAASVLEDRRAFGFVVKLSTLRQMRGAIDAAIAALE